MAKKRHRKSSKRHSHAGIIRVSKKGIRYRKSATAKSGWVKVGHAKKRHAKKRHRKHARR
jgi:hypothetical protein